MNESTEAELIKGPRSANPRSTEYVLVGPNGDTRWSKFDAWVDPNRPKIWLILCIFAGFVSVGLGRDIGWDLRNYHLYVPYQMLHDRFSIDIDAAQIQTYFNPLSDFILYGLITSPLNVYPRLISFFMGALHGLNAGLVWALCCKLINTPHTFERLLLRFVALLIGLSGAGVISVVGTGTGDLFTSIFILTSLVLILNLSDPISAPRQRGFAIAGLSAGFGIGLKYTSGIFAPGLALLAVVVSLRRKSFAPILYFGLASAVGLSLSAGHQLYRLWVLFANPIFPLMNTIFQSPLAEISLYRLPHTTNSPENWGQALAYPFYWLTDNTLVNQVPFSDPRCALEYVAIVFGASVFLFAWGRHKATSQPLLLTDIFVIVSFAFWAVSFGQYRFIVVIEMLSGPIVIATLILFAWNTASRLLLATTCLLAAVLGTHYFQWGRGGYAGNYVEVSVPPLPQHSLVLLPGLGPVSYFIPFSEPSASYIGLENNFLQMSQGNALVRIIKDQIAAAKRRIFALEIEGINDEALFKVLSNFELEVRYDTCAPITSNIDAAPLRLCELGPGSPDPKRSLEITAFGPTSVEVGQPFNVQPNGASAIWLRASRNIPANYRIRLGTSVLNSVAQNNVATAEVPISLLRHGGSLPIGLVAPDGTPRSNSLSLQVIDRTVGFLEITAFGPMSVEVGQPFNVQPNGASAMWVRASKAIPAGSHVRLGDSVLDTSIEGAVATAEVPISLLRYGGSLPISLVAPDGTPRSNSLSLQVIDRTAGLLEITAFGPTSIEVGQPFNVQPNGASAMWVRAAKGIPVGSHIRLGDSVLDTSIEGAVATAEVPASLIQRAGDLSISLAGPNGDQLSNAVVFHLSERNSPPPQ